jgi:hypothetical protein
VTHLRKMMLEELERRKHGLRIALLELRKSIDFAPHLAHNAPNLAT